MLVPQVGGGVGGEGGRVLRISSDRDNRKIFGGFETVDFRSFLGSKLNFGKYLFG